MIFSQARLPFLFCLGIALIGTLADSSSRLVAQNASSWTCFTEPLRQIKRGDTSAGFESAIAGSLSPTITGSLSPTLETESMFETSAVSDIAGPAGTDGMGTLELSPNGISGQSNGVVPVMADSGLNPVNVDVPYVVDDVDATGNTTLLVDPKGTGSAVPESTKASRFKMSGSGVLAYGSATGSANPEPGSLVLLSLGGIALLGRRRRN